MDIFRLLYTFLCVLTAVNGIGIGKCIAAKGEKARKESSIFELLCDLLVVSLLFIKVRLEWFLIL